MPRIERESMKVNSKPHKLSIEKRIQSIDFVDEINILIYGKSGTGKTTLWSSFPKPILAIVCSGIVKSGELKSISKEDRKHIKEIKLTDTSDIFEIKEYLDSNPGLYNTVVLDHATGLQDLCLKEILGLDEVPTQKEWGLATQQEYGQCSSRCKEYFSTLLSLDTNSVIIAQERDFKSENDLDNLAPTIGANLMPLLSMWLHSTVDYACNTGVIQKKAVKKITTGEGEKKKTVEKVIDTDEVDYILRTYPSEKYAIKFRKPKSKILPKYIIDPSYEKIIDIIKE